MSRSKERGKPVGELTLAELRSELVRCQTMIPLLKHSKGLRQRMRQIKARLSGLEKSE